MPRGPELVIEERGATRAALHVRELGERAADPRPAFERIGRKLREAEAQWFNTHGAGRWPPLTAETADQKAAQGERAGTLIASGALLRSLTSRSAVKVKRTELEFGTDVPYARFHQYGTRDAPKRPPIVPATPRVRKEMTDEVRAHVLKRGRRV